MYQRFRRWAKKGIFERIYRALADAKKPRSGTRSILIDSSIVRTHQDARRSRGVSSKEEEAIGRSRGGLSTKIHAAVDEAFRLHSLTLSPGQAHDITEAPTLVAGLHKRAGHIVADRGYDCARFRALISARSMTPVIPYRKNAKQPEALNVCIYGQRNIVERFFLKIKTCRRIATLFDKTQTSYLAMIFLASIVALR